MSTISRRAFLKTLGAAALSAGAVSVLAGCTGAGGSSSGTGTALLTGQPGTTYTLNGSVSVAAVSSTGTNMQSLSVAAGTPGSRWADVYENAYVKEAKSYTGVKEYDDLKPEQRAAARAAAESAVEKMGSETALVYFNLTNYTGAEMLVAGGSSGTADCVFTASCGGSSIGCTVDPAVVTQTYVPTKVTCAVRVPANSKSFQVVVSAPGGANQVKYTYTNTAYQDPAKIDPSKFDFS